MIFFEPLMEDFGMLLTDIGNLHFSTPAEITTTVLNLLWAVLIFVSVDVIFFLFIKKWSMRSLVLVTEVAVILGWMFDIYLLMILSGLCWIGSLVFSIFVNFGEVRAAIKSGKNKAINKLFRRGKENGNKGEELFDREKVYQKVVAAVVNLSRNRVGALITFERGDDLSDQMKTGTLLDAPVSAELLQTIFYPGTRLHDGAVIIRKDKIAAASVYFRPTTRPLTGKFGSRHRAAFGISESTDSVTILVSEETGRVSIAFQGELTPVTPDNILRILKEDMETEIEETEE